MQRETAELTLYTLVADGLNEIRSDPVSLGLPPLTTEQEAKCNVINADMSFVPCTSQGKMATNPILPKQHSTIKYFADSL